ncbi:HupE/UreJ family protein [Novosphingobium album (ex Liu et al. 2023)]|uniref:HupE/UreJ family protein n=1 Tax=Novosphingobium album (ex Liu et al. 2023) TaxID=3031130 RepID=A0ABT5WUQ3_9SPHN|nr:HupE/UreJ family protein [Novosphingobium album (ex Liu et al. 2023)]MDE8653588.1 HupE/UreJ family protein [Novosphingobium album (ex Liu et al. 2023)]
MSNPRPLPRALAAFLLLALLAALLPAPALADVFRIGDYDLQRGADPGTYELSVTIPEVLASNDPLGLPEGCRETGRERAAEGTVMRYTIGIACEGRLPADARIVTPWAVDGGTFSTSVSGTRVQMPLQTDGEALSLPLAQSVQRARPLPEIARYYTWQGVLHILGGWDHLSFVLCLCLLARGRFLLLLVTTFTVGHSLSLALAFFDVIHMPVPPVEAVIALSIAFMAREAIMVRADGVVSPAQRRREMAVVAGFGLLHGLGFATVLRELGVAPGERASGLLFFNAGVELGQLLFVCAVLAIMAIANALGQREPVRRAALYGAGIIGCFWAIERVAGFSLGMA